ncbi:response regulator transcription factor [Hwangdonia sp.]|uniref:response regulator transcription factor n=1 Tax=Hwangdonia sp. TaxID=1883432 RepID=UPI003AB6A0DA
MKKTIVIFALLILALLLVFQIGKYAMVSGDLKTEIVVAGIAIVFFFVGIYINKKSLHKQNAPLIEINHKKIDALGITNREYEVLQHISLGLSNKEIADTLYVSESTIKSHVSNLLVKLNAKRRTQAIQIAKKLQII